MIPNRSPWIHQLNRTREVIPLQQNTSADVAIVGGGIAGVSTAFFTLRDTKKNVILLEADKIAHGATGHNAGQITSYFERSFSSLVKEFGLELAAKAQRSVEGAWILIDEMFAEAQLQTPLHRFTGYAGLSRIEDVVSHLESNRLRSEGGIPVETMILAEGWSALKDIPPHYQSFYTTLKHPDLLKLLETKNADYIAALCYPKGCMNSALFTEEVARYLETTYPDRFTLFEGTPVKTVRMRAHTALLETLSHTVTAERVVLCTNGFEHFTIINEAGSEINTSFHHDINGRIGYMVGYIEPMNAPPTAISYYEKEAIPSTDPAGESYYYLTRRPHEESNGIASNLLCAGGPDTVLPNYAEYSKEASCSEEMRFSLDNFLYMNYANYPGKRAEYTFCWHGLMGYTSNRVRLIGPEPCNLHLLYNLGCNGVGILPSVYGGHRIAQFLKGTKLKPSIFDPRDHRVHPRNPFAS